MIMSNTFYGGYRTRTFSEIFPSYESFETDYNAIPFGYTFNKPTTLKTAYYLLIANYANSHIASSDENQFKIKVMATLFQYGLTWEKRLELQEKFRNITDEQLREGALQIYNNANNPDVSVNTNIDDGILPFVSNQNTAKHKKGFLESYTMLDALLRSDLNRDFIVKFKPLFIRVLAPDYPLLYETVNEEEND